MTTIQGTVLRITFRNEENGYTVAKLRVQENPYEEIPLVGYFSSIDVGETGEFLGEWVNDPHYGQQFNAERMNFIVPTTTKGIETLLSKGKFKGIGEKFAKKIVEKFGADTIAVIETQPYLLREIPGITENKIEHLVKAWNKKIALKNITLFLAEKDIPLHYAEKIYARYKENSVQILKTNPYQLTYDIRGIGFKTADKIALDIGFSLVSIERLKALLIYLLRQSAEDGHIFLPKDELIQAGLNTVETDILRLEEGLEQLRRENRVVIEDTKVFLRFFYAVECNVVKRIVEIQNTNALHYNNIENTLKEIHNIEQSACILYTSQQQEAIITALSNKIIVITGGPGTGKTTLICALLQIFQKQGLNVRLAAPTGRAAKRMEEASSYSAQTIHRLLEYTPQNGYFTRHLGNPVDADVIIIDEISMVDTPLMAALLSGLNNNSRLILVGDADQLPSVGPGNILRDVITSGLIPIVRLDTIFRQDEASDIVIAAHKINSGELPSIENTAQSNLFFLYEPDTAVIPDKIVDLVMRRLPEKYHFDPVKDIQVLTSMYKGETGAIHLNALLQHTLNHSKASIKRGERSFYLGDKVMQVRNNYTKDVYNGDIGFIQEIDIDNEVIAVQYDDRIVSYAFYELDDVVLAYAVTVHKSQGSEYKAVIMPLTTQHYIMLQRNLLYTAVTRAKELMILIGTKKALNIAVRNNKTAQRYTYLAERLRTLEGVSSQLNLPDTLKDSLQEWY